MNAIDCASARETPMGRQEVSTNCTNYTNEREPESLHAVATPLLLLALLRADRAIRGQVLSLLLFFSPPFV